PRRRRAVRRVDRGLVERDLGRWNPVPFKREHPTTRANLEQRKQRLRSHDRTHALADQAANQRQHYRVRMLQLLGDLPPATQTGLGRARGGERLQRRLSTPDTAERPPDAQRVTRTVKPPIVRVEVQIDVALTPNRGDSQLHRVGPPTRLGEPPLYRTQV